MRTRRYCPGIRPISHQKSEIGNRTVALITGKLAEPALRAVAGELADAGLAQPVVIVLPIQVAALMTAEWVTRKLSLPADVRVDRVILPGHCQGDVGPLVEKLGVSVERGPKDLQDLPELFGQARRDATGYGGHAIEIIAEVNHAARTPIERLVEVARQHAADGADVIDVGCDPDPGAGAGGDAGRPAWEGVGDAVRALRDAGLRVSIDSFHRREVALACAAGAELVLSVNSGNRHLASEWGAQVVAIPDTPGDAASLDQTVESLDKQSVPFRIDPVIEPIGLGFAASIGRYIEARRRYPRAAMMMGVGNLTEMTEVDSAGVNALLIGLCAELGVGSVLTTQVINWARSSVREIDIARRLMHHAVQRQTPPKHLDPRLVMLRDRKLRPFGAEHLAELARSLTDRNIRIFAEGGKLHAMNKDFHLIGDDPFELFDQMRAGGWDDDLSHAFYLGYEMAKAVTALTLGKHYAQDRALEWGMLTRPEKSHRARRKKRKDDGNGGVVGAG